MPRKKSGHKKISSKKKVFNVKKTASKAKRVKSTVKRNLTVYKKKLISVRKANIAKFQADIKKRKAELKKIGKLAKNERNAKKKKKLLQRFRRKQKILSERNKRLINTKKLLKQIQSKSQESKDIAFVETYDREGQYHGEIQFKYRYTFVDRDMNARTNPEYEYEEEEETRYFKYDSLDDLKDQIDEFQEYFKDNIYPRVFIEWVNNPYDELEELHNKKYGRSGDNDDQQSSRSRTSERRADNIRQRQFNPLEDIQEDPLAIFKFGYDYLPIDDNNIPNCGLNWIWNRYSKIIKNCKKCHCIFDKSHLCEIMNIEDFDEKITIRKIQKFAEHFNIPHYAVDLKGCLITSYKPEKRHYNYPSLCYCASNNHFYPVNNKSFIKSLARKDLKKMNPIKSTLSKIVDIFSTNNKSKKESKKKVERTDRYLKIKQFQSLFERKKLRNLNIFIVDLKPVDFMKEVYLFVFKITNKFSLCSSVGNMIGSMYNREYNLSIKSVPSDIPYTHVIKYAKLKNMPYKGKSLQNLLFANLRNLKRLNRTTTNTYTKNIIDTWNISPFINKFKDTEDFDYFQQCLSLDFTKFYENIIRNFKHNIPVPTCFDSIEKYNNEELQDNCYYYIETNNYFPFKKNGWYSFMLVNNVKKYYKDIYKQIKITHKLKCSLVENKTNLTNLVNEIYDELDIFDSKDYTSKLGKNMVRRVIGMFNKTRISREQYYFFTNTSNIKRCVDAKQNVYISKLKDHGIKNTTIYKAVEKKILNKEYNYKHIYKNIIDMAAFKLYSLYRKMQKIDPKLDLLSIKVDAISIHSPKIKHLINIGRINIHKLMHLEDIKEIKKTDIKPIITRNQLPVEMPNNEWNHINRKDIYKLIDNRKSFRNRGMPGTGKTWTINNIIIPYMEKKKIMYKRLAPTHIASLLINGNTIHSTFMMDFKTSTICKKCLSEIKKYDYFIVDECSMVNNKCWFVLKILKEKGFKFIITGDYNQLPAVENINFDYEHSILLKWICDFNVYTNLYDEKISRYDKELHDICIDILDDNFNIHDLNESTEISDEYVNICLRNKTRKAINKRIMLKKYKDYNKRILIKYNDGELLTSKDNSSNIIDVRQNLFIYKDLPLIARRTKEITTINNEKVKIHNNEYFIVDKIIYEVKNGKEKEHILIKSDMGDLFKDKQFTITQEEFKNSFLCPRYALTIWGAQGLTITKKIMLFEYGLLEGWVRPHQQERVNTVFSSKKKKVLYTFVSRGTKKDNVYISYYYYGCKNVGNIGEKDIEEDTNEFDETYNNDELEFTKEELGIAETYDNDEYTEVLEDIDEDFELSPEELGNVMLGDLEDESEYEE